MKQIRNGSKELHRVWLDDFVCQFQLDDAKDLCEEVIERLKPSTRWYNSGVASGKVEPNLRDSMQISYDPNSPPVEHEPLLAFAQECLDVYTTERKEAGDVPAFGMTEGYNILKYKGDGSQAYHAVHSDQGWPNNIHRHVSFCMYLNDIEEGGETEFPAHELKIEPKAGRGLIFPASWVYSHRSLPHKTGVDRYVFNIFYGFITQEVKE
tara:strand:- start:22062 stop:22688 length:627 start_codon:yes stop_codon:yes gene_type:complete